MGLVFFLLSFLLTQQQKPQYAAHYAPHRMEQVARNRNMSIVDCMVASPYYPIGTWLEVSSKYGKKKCRVTDVPRNKRDKDYITSHFIVVELDFNSAKLICHISRVNQEPPSACPVKVRLLQ